MSHRSHLTDAGCSLHRSHSTGFAETAIGLVGFAFPSRPLSPMLPRPPSGMIDCLPIPGGRCSRLMDGLGAKDPREGPLGVGEGDRSAGETAAVGETADVGEVAAGDASVGCCTIGTGSPLPRKVRLCAASFPYLCRSSSQVLQMASMSHCWHSTTPSCFSQSSHNSAASANLRSHSSTSSPRADILDRAL